MSKKQKTPTQLAEEAKAQRFEGATTRWSWLDEPVEALTYDWHKPVLLSKP